MNPMELAVFQDARDRLASTDNTSPAEHVVEPTRFAYAYRSDLPPLCTVAPGDTVAAITQDASNGRIRSVEHLPALKTKRPYVNPLTGPLRIEGAEPGDTLVVKTLSIQPLEGWGYSWARTQSGALAATALTALLNPPLEEEVWFYPIQGDEIIFQARRGDRGNQAALPALFGFHWLRHPGGGPRQHHARAFRRQHGRD